MNRRIRPLAAWIALFALLFAQLATAAYACPQLVERPAATSSPDCDHDRDVTPNLCERHCADGKVSLDTPKPMAMPDMAATFVRPVLFVAIADAPRAQPRARIATGPPPTRFTVLRI
jgi:hypothetical protein